MGGVLKLGSNAAWVPATWVYDNALESLASEVEGTDTDLAASLLGSTSERKFPYLDLSAAAPARLVTLLGAATRHRDRSMLEGPKDWHDPDFFAGYINQLAWLVDLLEADQRVATSGMNNGPRERFLKSLAETVVWCSGKADLGNPAACFRSSELRPVCRAHPKYKEPGVWKCEGDCRIPCRGRHDELVVRRRAALGAAGRFVSPDVLRTARGRLLLYNSNNTLNDGGTPHGTRGLFDDWDVPAWDLWVQDVAYDPPADMRLGAPPWMEYRALVSWIPEEFVPLVEDGAMPWDSYGFMCWADESLESTPDEGGWRPYLPTWLNGLRLPLPRL